MSESTTKPRRNWLCIAYAFPPIQRSGMHRTLAFVRHLHRANWDATVLTVTPGDEPMDHTSLTDIPDSTLVIPTRWFRPIESLASLRRLLRPIVGHVAGDSHRFGLSDRQMPNRGRLSVSDWVSRLLHTPDSRIGWIPPAVWTGLHAIRRRRPDVLYSTSPYASAHLAALILNRLTRIPWVADFRDPWCANPFRDLPYSTLRKWDAWLESTVLRKCSRVVCNTPTMARDFARRYPDAAPRLATIPNGIDFDHFANIQPRRLGSRNEFVMLHSGQFYGRRSPRVLFKALRRFVQCTERKFESVRLALLGPEWFDGRHLLDLACESGVAEWVDVLGQRCHGESLSCMAGANALVLVGGGGSGGELQVPNKLFEYMALRKPILALLAPDSPARTILAEARADAVICEPANENAILGAMHQLADPARTTPDDAWAGIARFDRAHRADELLALFGNLIQTKKRAVQRDIQIPCSMKGFVARSRPMVVSGP